VLLAEFLNLPVNGLFLHVVRFNRLLTVFLQARGRNGGQFPFPPGGFLRRQGTHDAGGGSQGRLQAWIQFLGQRLYDMGGNAVSGAAGKTSGQGEQQQGGKFFHKRNGYLLR